MAGGGMTLILLEVLRFILIVIGLGLLITYFLHLYFVCDAIANDDGVDFTDVWFLILVSLYGILFAGMTIVIELRVRRFFEKFKSYQDWIIRGLFYIFQGVLSLGMGAAQIEFARVENDKPLRKFQEAMAYSIMICGAILVLAELLCVKRHAEREAQQEPGVSNIV